MGEIIRPMANEDVTQVGDILFRSFNGVAVRNGLPPKLKDPEAARAWAWSLMVNKTTVKFVSESDGRVTGISCLNPRGTMGGIGPTAVDPEARQVLRRQPTVYSLLEAVLKAGESLGSIRGFLEAFNTAAYNIAYSVGLLPVEVLHHYTFAKNMRDKTPPAADVVPAGPADLEAIMAYDAPRSRLDRRGDMGFYLRWGKVFVHRSDAGIRGYLVCLPGKEHVQIGPLLADTQEVAVELVRKAALSVEKRPFQLRTMSRDEALNTALRNWGFRLESLNFLIVRGPWRPGPCTEALGMYPEGT